jgi:beta-galactosidase
MVHLLPHWNWEGFEGKEIPVWCFTNAESVELFLNGKSLGKRNWSATKKLHFEWSVPYQPGVLKAVASKGGQTVAVDEVYTAGKPARLVVTPDRSRVRADGEDLSFVEVRIVDKDGHLCPNASNEIVFSLTGPAVIAGVGNGDPTNHESFQGRKHRAFHGLCLAVIRATHEAGQFHLTVTAEGLDSSPVSSAAVAPAE